MGDRPLPVTSLSSGEQHELVLLYELLFKVNPDSLILIDEPELSLHIAWQQQFLQDLQKITQLASFDVLIATHSPQIIHDRWDLTVELKGPETS
jgi:predicted ATP-binding protein involved in virulence